MFVTEFVFNYEVIKMSWLHSL